MTSETLEGQGPGGSGSTIVDSRAATVAELITKRIAETPDREAFRFPDGAGWSSVTWAEVGERVRNLAAGLIALGIEPQQRVAISSVTRYEWILADLAIMSAGAATTTVYPTTTTAEVGHILSDSESRIVFAEDAEQVAKVLENRADIPELTTIVTFEPVDDDTSGTADDADDPVKGENDAGIAVLGIADLERQGAEYLEEHPEAVDQAMAAIGSDSLATLIYTSGTTGLPKGVRLNHDCWTYEGACIDALGLVTADHLQYLWLPLAHSFGKVLLAAQLQIGFPTAVDGRIDKIVQNLGVVKPAWMASAPRVFEKAYARIVTTVQAEGGVKAKLFDWAFGVGSKVSKLRQEGKEPTGLLAVQHRIADKLVFTKIRERFGGRLEFFVSGSAALNREIAEWFHAAGILILEGYGLTETSAGASVCLPGKQAFGAVGPPLPGTEVKIADDGEVLVKGPGVMQGYHNLTEETAAVFDEDGWFKTGDIGELTDNGLLWITDRKKDLFKTSGGKYVAPQLIESKFKAIFPYVSQIIVHGEGRNFVSALITFDPDQVPAWAEHEGLGDRPYEEVVSSDIARQRVQEAIDQLNARLNRWETIKKFVILDHDLTIEQGEMTPSMKVRRRAVEQRYTEQLDELYA